MNLAEMISGLRQGDAPRRVNTHPTLDAMFPALASGGFQNRGGTTIVTPDALRRVLGGAQPNPAPSISTPQDYWLKMVQGKAGRDMALERRLGIGAPNALTRALPFLGL